MSTNVFRINKFSLLKITDIVDIMNFFQVKDEINLTTKQYLDANDDALTVWLSGTYAQRVNTSYLGTLYTPINVVSEKYQEVSLLLPQGFSWLNVYGIHIVIKTINSGDILISKLCTSNEFHLTQNKELINGTFWLEEIVFNIPKVLEGIETQITIIKNEDIDLSDTNIGYIYPSLTSEFITLISEKPIPDFIVSVLNLDENQFATFGIKTTELSKTIEESILDYFGLQTATISIKHFVNYGNDTFGYKAISLSNEINKYSDVTVGLNLLEFYDSNNPTLKVNIMLTTQITVNNTIMTRTNQLSTDLSDLSPFIESLIVHPATNYPVTVENVITNNNTIIESKKSTKIIPVIQPIFVELIHDDIIFEQKKIYFQNITQPANLILNAGKQDVLQILISDKTSDNKYYFDLTKLIQITENSTYQLIDFSSQSIIGKGNLLMK